MLIITPTISSGRVNSMGKVLIAYFHMAKIRNYWKSPMKFCFYEISRPKIFRYIKLQFTDFCINKTRSTATCEICLLLEEKKRYSSKLIMHVYIYVWVNALKIYTQIRFIEYNSILFYKAIKVLADSHEKHQYILVLIMKMFNK